jgi:hypothetical protein
MAKEKDALHPHMKITIRSMTVVVLVVSVRKYTLYFIFSHPDRKYHSARQSEEGIFKYYDLIGCIGVKVAKPSMGSS